MPKYRFDEIAINSTEKGYVDEYERHFYIGLEHLDSGTLKVSRWGSDVPISGEKLKMKKGDVLFGKRNTYLRRAAIAPHDGFFSAHGMVLRPKTEVVDPDFFPMFISSDYFFDEAIRISVGSLSPTVNWKDLRELEFDLPSLSEQRTLARQLGSINDTIDAYKKLTSKTDDLVKARFLEMFGDSKDSSYERITVGDAIKKGYIARPLDGNHGEKHPKGDDYVSAGVPFLMAQDLKEKRVDFESCHFITEKQAKTLTKGWAQTGDVLITHKGTIGRVAIVQPSKYASMLLTPQITYYRCIKDLDNHYLAAFFETDFFRTQLDKLTTGSTRASVTITQQERLILLIPPLNLQKEFVSFVEQSDRSKAALQKTIKKLEDLRSTIIRESFIKGNS